MASLLHGCWTVEAAAEALGLEPTLLVDNAVLAGAPKGYGPFPSVEGSRFRIMLDEADTRAWNAAGRPIGGIKPEPKPRRKLTFWQWLFPTDPH